MDKYFKTYGINFVLKIKISYLLDKDFSGGAIDFKLGLVRVVRVDTLTR